MLSNCAARASIVFLIGGIGLTLASFVFALVFLSLLVIQQ